MHIPYVQACDLFTLVLSWLDVCVLPLVSIEPRLHAEVWLPAPLVQLVPWFVSRQTVTQYSLKHTTGERLRHATTAEQKQCNKNRAREEKKKSST